MEYCHYFDSSERQKHLTDVKPCGNCSVPVCSSCRTSQGFCIECEQIKESPDKLRFRAVTMQDYYDRMKKANLL